MRKLMLSIFSFVLALPAMADVERRVANNGNLVMEDVPEIPAEIADSLNRYQNVRSAGVVAWSGDGKSVFINTRFEPAGFTKISALGVEEQRVLVIADFTSPPALWERLGDGYRLEASFLLWEGDDILQIPASAVFRYKDGWAAFAVEGRKAKRRTISVGRRNGLVAQILSGLDEGETVIVLPSDKIDDRTRVRKR